MDRNGTAGQQKGENSMQKPILELKNISLISKDKIILKNINLKIQKGALIAILGESGSGKSTMLKIIAGWEKPSKGRVLMTLPDRQVDITDLPSNERDIHLMPPNYELFINKDARKNIAFGLKHKGLKVGEVNAEVEQLIEELELKGYEYRFLKDLSSGQQQRISFARTIIGKPSILLLDEPFSALNDRLRVIIQNIIKRYQVQYGMTVICTMHDKNAAMEFSDEVLTMANGELK